ncbi:hypothetical protein SAMN04488540_11819 [Ferrimonas sediminum]|uniref:UPF0208 membrane protein YfbV n=1 Tax=Ferrimonas sediminum TaxID=718193 RepID=A0A1G8YR49_9GAMM|nr:terminus macrodomain insulation protein YfbV [Ferrimonas sediminum]SDK05261.1 hypothetical protein SAMN04488540_11819 [Ferrimonas sediminum]
MTFFETLRCGSDYMREWPKAAQLAPLFPEHRVIRATELAIRVMPPIAVFCFWLQYQSMGATSLPQAIASGLFLLSLPLQGLFWLGWRSQQPLPKPLLVWCDDLRSKMVAAGEQIAPLGASARYLNMAKLLRRVFTKIERGEWQRFD